MKGRHPAEAYDKVFVLRLGHRPLRDKRITTHVALVARAFGANGFVMEVCDDAVISSIKKTIATWGGKMEITCGVDPISYVSSWKSEGGEVIHLTMYGIPVDEIVDVIAASVKRKLIIVGAEKVEPVYYSLADYNVAITNQPHSEVSALAIFLDRLYRGRWDISYEGARLRIVPSARGKKVMRIERGEADK